VENSGRGLTHALIQIRARRTTPASQFAASG
jgi:hypothetical protein